MRTIESQRERLSCGGGKDAWGQKVQRGQKVQTNFESGENKLEQRQGLEYEEASGLPFQLNKSVCPSFGRSGTHSLNLKAENAKVMGIRAEKR